MNQNGSPLPAIVLGLEHPRAVALVTTLGALGVPVIGVDFQHTPRTSASRFLKQTHRIDNSAEATLALLTRLGEQGGGVLMPTLSEYVIQVSQNAEALSRRFKLTVPGWDVAGALISLPSAYAMARELGIKTPNIFTPRDEPELRTIAASLDLTRNNYVLRTPSGSAYADTGINRYTRSAGDSAQTIIDNCMEIHARTGELPVIAEAIPVHPEQCIAVQLVIDAKHEIVIEYAVKRLTLVASDGGFVHPYRLGTHVYCETVHDDEALEAARRIATRSGYTGSLVTEFRRDPRDGELVLIKADLSLAREMTLSRALDQDVLVALYRTATGAPQSKPKPYRDGVAWFWPTAYVNVLLSNRDDRRLFRELLSTLKRLPRVRGLAYWDRRDPGPFFVDVGLWLQRTVVARFRRLLGAKR